MKMRIAGIMTGTSLDGIDIAISDFTGDENTPFEEKLIAYKTFPFTEELRNTLNNIMSGKFTAYEFSQLNFILAKAYDNAIKELCRSSMIDHDSIEAIGMHGQTLWHQPKAKNYAGESIASTLQAGSGTALSAFSRKTVVYDFRAADIALGGQGAPLVPIYDYYFLRNEKRDTIAMNIGGIANITFLPKGNNSVELDKNAVRAFDTGPGNVLIDIAANELFNQKYDDKGALARIGNVIPELLEKLLDIDFIHKNPPKSTGREEFNAALLGNIFNSDYSTYDILNTLTEFTAQSIALNIRKFASENSEIIITGGGAMNDFLMERIKNALPRAEIANAADKGINADAKEAQCFAFLAYLHLKKIPGNLPSVTGASREIILGASAGA